MIFLNFVFVELSFSEYFQEGQEESLQTVLRRMQSDKDRDVRYFADHERFKSTSQDKLPISPNYRGYKDNEMESI